MHRAQSVTVTLLWLAYRIGVVGQCCRMVKNFSFSGPWAILNWGSFWKADVAAGTFSSSTPVPKFLKPDPGPGPKSFQV